MTDGVSSVARVANPRLRKGCRAVTGSPTRRSVQPAKSISGGPRGGGGSAAANGQAVKPRRWNAQLVTARQKGGSRTLVTLITCDQARLTPDCASRLRA